jgi:hypothetical protein
VDQDAVDKLVTLYCAAWDEPDRERRRAMLEQVFEADGVYVDPTVRLTGVLALVDHIEKVSARYPGSTLLRTTRIDWHHEMLRFGWRKKLANGHLLPSSVDFCRLSEQGRLRLVVGFFGEMTDLDG